MGRERDTADAPRLPGAPVFDALQLAEATRAVLAANGDDAAALARRQAARLTRLVGAARAGSALYRERLKGITPGRTPLADWPAVTKPELMQRFDDWVTDPALQLDALRAFTADPERIGQAFAGRWQVWESSGSSGEPAIFVQDAQAMAVYDALEALRRSTPHRWQRWFDPLGLGERYAFVGATGGHFATYVSTLRLQRLNPWMAGRLRCFSILQPTADLLTQLQDYAPTVIATYPSAAALLADEALSGRLAMRPREVWTGGETLSAAVRQHVQQVFGCALCNSYGASEFLAIGWQCEHGRLHANTDWALLEPVDAQGRPVPAGVQSHTTLLTHLAQFAQPLIRYDLGDRLTLMPEPCNCGSPLPVIEVLGRCDDALHLTGRHGRLVTLLPLALTTVLEDDARLYDFQLQQRDRHTLVLRVPLPAAQAGAALARGCAALHRFCEQQGLQGLQIVGEAGPALLHGRSGKTCRVLGLPDTR
ncbi:MAG: AMP-binding protein [Aquabacterium sp.]|nr:AMP-binding protein [Aquabacterium sp.]